MSSVYKKNSKAGFTLIELVITIGILSILALFALLSLNPLQQFAKARDASRKSDLGQLQKVLEQYYQDNGSYPVSNGGYVITDFNGHGVNWGSASGWPPYLNAVPQDPDSNNRTYVYYTQNGVVAPQRYYLYASLELGPNDSETCMATSTNCIKNPTNVNYCNCPNVPSGINCGTKIRFLPCNYGVTSPNTTP